MPADWINEGVSEADWVGLFPPPGLVCLLLGRFLPSSVRVPLQAKHHRCKILLENVHAHAYAHTHTHTHTSERTAYVPQTIIFSGAL